MRAKTSSAAPTMNSDSPRSAWLASRPTGASANAMPFADAAAASRSVTRGSIVLMSTTTLPRRTCASTPSRPRSPRSTIAESGSIVKTMSDDGRHAAHVRRGLRAQRFERAHRRRHDVVHAHPKSLAAEIRRHGPTHVAQTDEADPRRGEAIRT